ncbi:MULTISPECIES: HAD family hydrolase [Thermomonospora]|uniref:HAD-superfamily hydrolase, subfamily IA, variant 3 n=1 Tax=Thermomonospora curvata (strain ATCC 19995 / DSM 43183 / JCM 3096 / KCTC 9072 / NBRC 15933 / NCIMB 10081 / Henssen B9) TaxID=471852 RepID=D1AAH5_THECD|nr:MULTISPECIES: HAD family phosphatase [Thermomonospora]ACY98888.1 HAD-superfamily hydrolase, subfamily IA, variant 3 [Thermomonospora curvata DSM 43183]PKK13389.1 MAG: HAD family phosphatase [Thermomonospora sp. CIF 1]
MPEAIVFDLYGVIATHQPQEAKRAIERLAGIEPGDAAGAARFWDAYWALRPAYDAGQPAAEYWRAVAGRLGVSFADPAALARADLESWTAVDEEMVALVTELAERGHRLGLLSNIVADLVPVMEERHGHWLRRFAALTYSCRIGVAKPDPRAYEICARRLGVAPSDVLFFDDNEVNVQAARAVGMSAEVFTSPGQVRRVLAACGR